MKILLFFVSFFCAGFCFLPVAMAAEVSYAGGDFYLPANKTAYQINKRIVLSPKMFFKVEKGVSIDFGPNGDICFSEKDCLKGDWILKNGLKSCSLVFESLFYLYVDTGTAKINFQLNKNNSNESWQKTKELPLLIRSLDSGTVYAKLKLVKDEYSFRFFIDVMMADGANARGGSFFTPTSFLPSVASSISVTNALNSDSSVIIDVVDKFFSCRQSGLIFLETQKNGEAWYVNPANCRRYYLGRPTDAFFVMKSLGLGVKHKIIQDGVFSDSLRGRILIDVEDKGRAYYVSPKNKKAYYLGRPEDAFRVMVDLGVGISEENIRKIETGRI